MTYFWTEDERDYLRNNYKDLSVAEISNHLGRSISAVRSQAIHLNLLKRNWSDDEISYLKENWGNTSIPNISKHLKRSESAIMLKVHKLGFDGFLESGNGYVTKHFLLKVIGRCGNDSYTNISYIQNRGLPTHKIKVRTHSFVVVYLDEWWEWAEANQSFLDFSKFEKYALGPEPEWVAAKRSRDIKMRMRYKKTPWTPSEDALLVKCVKLQKYTYRQLSDKLQRTEGAILRRLNDLNIKHRPIKADTHIKWTNYQYDLLGKMIKAGDTYEMMSDVLGKSAKAIRGRVFDVYLTEKLDKVRAYISDGEWGDGAPDKPVRYMRLMEQKEKEHTKLLLSQFAGYIQAIAKNKSNVEVEFNEYWQKDTCMNWDDVHGCTAGESDCDSCTSFRRIPVQYCKRCGKDFFERKSNYFCNDCR